MRPRSQQTRIDIRSDKAWAKLQTVRRDGRTYSEIVEEALERMWLQENGLNEDDWRASLADSADEYRSDDLGTCTAHA